MVREVKEKPGRQKDLFDVLKNRLAVLSRLTESPKSKPELIEEIGVSRSTVSRSLKELQSEGMVERELEGYRTTLFGIFSAELMERTTAQLDTLVESKPLLSLLDSDSPLSLGFVCDGEVIEEDRALKFMMEKIKSANRLRLITAASNFNLEDLIHHKITEEGMEAEMLMGKKAVRHLVTRHKNSEYDDSLRERLLQDNYSLYEYEGGEFVPPNICMLWLKNDEEGGRTIMPVQSAGLQTKGLITSTSPLSNSEFLEFFGELKESSRKIAKPCLYPSSYVSHEPHSSYLGGPRTRNGPGSK